MQKLIRYVLGYLEITVEGIYVERFLNMCNYHKIELWNLKHENNKYKMNISISGYRKLKTISKKTKSKVRILEKYGIPFILHKYRKRHLFVLAFGIVIFSLYASTFYIHDIEINGNLFYTDYKILEELEKVNVRKGVSKEKINCDDIVRLIREKYDKVTWVSVHLQGTKLIISIKENSNVEVSQENSNLETPQNLVSDCDGIVVSIITRNGKPNVHPGDNVSAGDILVSGELEIVDDIGEVIEYRYVKPDADVVIQTELKYSDSINLIYRNKIFNNKGYKLFRIERKDKIITIGHKNKKRIKATRLYRELYDLKILKVGVEKYEEYIEEEKRYTKDEYQQILTDNFSKFCKDLEKKGVQILQNSVKIYSESKRAFASGTLTVRLKTGQMQQFDKKELKER